MASKRIKTLAAAAAIATSAVVGLTSAAEAYHRPARHYGWHSGWHKDWHSHYGRARYGYGGRFMTYGYASPAYGAYGYSTPAAYCPPGYYGYGGDGLFGLGFAGGGLFGLGLGPL